VKQLCLVCSLLALLPFAARGVDAPATPKLRLPVAGTALVRLPPARVATISAPARITVVAKSPVLPKSPLPSATQVRLRALPSPRPVDATSFRRLASESRLRLADSLKHFSVDAAMNVSIVASAVKPAGINGAGNIGSLLAARRTELAIAENPGPPILGQFPESGALRLATSVYDGAPVTLSLLIRSSAPGVQVEAPRHYLLQYASQASETGSSDWRHPPGLLTSASAQVLPQSEPIGPYDAGAIAGAGKPPKVASYARLAVPMPAAAANPGPTPYSVYLRVIPMSGGSASAPAARRPAVAELVRAFVPIAPPSNWVRVDVPGTLAELQARDAQKKAELAQAAQAAAEQELAEQKAKGLKIEIANAKWRMDRGYELQALSYLPPKFNDDGGIPTYFVLATDVNWSVGDKAFNWSKGDTYDVGAAINMLDSGASPLKQMWDLGEGILSSLSEGYETAKSSVVDAAAGAISATGIVACDAGCKSYLKTGLEFALAYCGVPPNIPNTRELYGQGADYLAANLANSLVEQGVGVDLPGGVAVDLAGAVARDQAREELFAASRKGINALVSKLGCPDPSQPNCGVHDDNPYTWGIPSPYFRRHPAVLYIRIKPAAPDLLKDSTPISLVVNASGSFSNQTTLPLNYIPASGLVIPIVLEPTDLSHWSQVAGYLNGLDCYCGQPYYYGWAPSTIRISTVHQVVSVTGNEPFLIQQDWPPIELDGAHPQDYEDGDIYNGFRGDMRPRFAYLPGG
jgi:hypothetical protein